MEFNKSVVEIIKERTSVRLYKKQNLTKAVLDNINNYIYVIQGPFDSKVKLKIINSTEISSDSEIKLGTYGVIKGTSTYIVTAINKEGNSLEQLGYVLEKVMLYATSLGLGTCWLGGTFKKGEFAKAIELKEDEILPIVSPLGFPAETRGKFESLMRLVVGSNKRKAWPEIFYNENFSTSLTEEAANQFKIPLEMVRLAPSASNKQPWKVLKENTTLHFYLTHAPGYSSTGFDMQRIDIGIAMSHFETTAKEFGIAGKWIVKAPEVGKLPDKTDYIVSWIS